MIKLKSIFMALKGGGPRDQSASRLSRYLSSQQPSILSLSWKGICTIQTPIQERYWILTRALSMVDFFFFFFEIREEVSAWIARGSLLYWIMIYYWLKSVKVCSTIFIGKLIHVQTEFCIGQNWRSF